MNVLKVKKGETLARKQDKVMEWYLIQEGSVIRQFAFAEIIMHRNAIVGILENEWFACDYVANEDTTLIVIPVSYTHLRAHETVLDPNMRISARFFCVRQWNSGIRHCVCMPVCRKNACFYIMLRKRCTANTKICAARSFLMNRIFHVWNSLQL